MGKNGNVFSILLSLHRMADGSLERAHNQMRYSGGCTDKRLHTPRQSFGSLGKEKKRAWKPKWEQKFGGWCCWRRRWMPGLALANWPRHHRFMRHTVIINLLNFIFRFRFSFNCAQRKMFYRLVVVVVFFHWMRKPETNKGSKNCVVHNKIKSRWME